MPWALYHWGAPAISQVLSPTQHVFSRRTFRFEHWCIKLASYSEPHLTSVRRCLPGLNFITNARESQKVQRIPSLSPSVCKRRPTRAAVSRPGAVCPPASASTRSRCRCRPSANWSSPSPTSVSTRWVLRCSNESKVGFKCNRAADETVSGSDEEKHGHTMVVNQQTWPETGFLKTGPYAIGQWFQNWG